MTEEIHPVNRDSFCLLERGGEKEALPESSQAETRTSKLTIQSCFLSSNLFSSASIHLLADKPMVITEPTVPSEQQHTLSNIDFCSALWLPARFPEQRLVPTHIEPSGRLAELLPSPRPHYSARPNRFVSRGPSEDVPVRLGYVTEVNWPRGHGKTPYRDQASETLKRSRLLEQNTNCKNVQYTSYSTV